VKLSLLTDGMFSSDGAIAPLGAYLKVLPRNAVLLVDDAHGAGTLGSTGKGVVELEGVPRSRVIQTVTLSKAFGVYGGLILGSGGLREKILAKSGMFVGSTPLPLPLANAAQTALHILRKEKGFRERLGRNVNYVKDPLSRNVGQTFLSAGSGDFPVARRNTGLESPVNRQAGKPALHSPSPIIAIIPKNAEEAEAIKKHCLQNGVFPSFIKYHGGPKDGYFRFVLSSEHSKGQLDDLLKALIGR